MMSKVLTVDQAIGQRLKELRGELGLRQDQVAKAARQAGLNWSQSTVAAIEGGNRSILLGEWFLLPHVLGMASGWMAHHSELADLLPDSGRVALTKETTTSVDVLRDALAGRLTHPDRKVLADFDTPYIRRFKESWRRQTAKLKELARIWPGMTLGGAEDAEKAAQGDAERKAARKLGVEPVKLSAAAYARYNRSFTEERDARVAAQMDAAPPAVYGGRQLVRDGNTIEPRTVQALRGHITRAMLTELATVFDQEGTNG
jgi:DNA-binding XRE family transcriptional regulator